MPTHITDAHRKAIAGTIVGLYRRIITVNGVFMPYRMAMMVRSISTISIMLVQTSVGTVVFGLIDMTAGAILHFVQTLTFAPVDMTIG